VQESALYALEPIMEHYPGAMVHHDFLDGLVMVLLLHLQSPKSHIAEIANTLLNIAQEIFTATTLLPSILSLL